MEFTVATVTPESHGAEALRLLSQLLDRGDVTIKRGMTFPHKYPVTTLECGSLRVDFLTDRGLLNISGMDLLTHDLGMAIIGLANAHKL